MKHSVQGEIALEWGCGVPDERTQILDGDTQCSHQKPVLLLSARAPVCCCLLACCCSAAKECNSAILGSPWNTVAAMLRWLLRCSSRHFGANPEVWCLPRWGRLWGPASAILGWKPLRCHVSHAEVDCEEPLPPFWGGAWGAVAAILRRCVKCDTCHLGVAQRHRGRHFRALPEASQPPCWGWFLGPLYALLDSWGAALHKGARYFRTCRLFCVRWCWRSSRTSLVRHVWILTRWEREH